MSYELNTFFADLNPPQRDAVLHTEGPLLILAGRAAARRG